MKNIPRLIHEIARYSESLRVPRFASNLERELAKAREQLEAMERARAEQARRADENREGALRAERERDEAREQAAELLEALELLLNQFDVEIHNEYDGTGMLNSRLSEANHARAAIVKAKGDQL